MGDGAGGVYERIECGYNRLGDVIAMKDPNQTEHAYGFDGMGWPAQDRITAFGDGVDDTPAYAGRISTEYDPKRPTLVAKVTSCDDATPGQGNVLDEAGFDYDDFGQRIEDAQAHDGAVDGSTPKVFYGYADGSSGNTARRQSITYPNGRKVNLGYGAADSIEDIFSLVKSVGIEGETGDKITYTRVGLGRFVEIAYPQPGVRMSMLRPGGGSEGDAGDLYDGFDRFGRTQAMRWEKITGENLLDGWNWGFNLLSNRTWRKNLVAGEGQDEAYGYDGLSQVIRDALGTLNINHTQIGGIPVEEEQFAYDPTGNWLGYKKDEDGSTVLDQTRSNNRDNQLTQIDASSQGIAYDNVGNAIRLRPGQGSDWSRYFQLVWDAWNRLVEVKDESGTTLQKNRYDGLTRRIVKTAGGVDTHYFYNDRWKPVEERLDSATTAARSYLWCERPGHRDELAFRDRDTNQNGALDERLYATMDHFHGTAILDTAGAVQERYAYSAFGVRRVMAPDFSVRTSSDFDWEFAFQGQFRDAETGWYDYGFRYYNPDTGKWLSRDPITESGGPNLYGFVYNNPLFWFDNLGREPQSKDPGSKQTASQAAHNAGVNAIKHAQAEADRESERTGRNVEPVEYCGRICRCNDRAYTTEWKGQVDECHAHFADKCQAPYEEVGFWHSHPGKRIGKSKFTGGVPPSRMDEKFVDDRDIRNPHGKPLTMTREPFGGSGKYETVIYRSNSRWTDISPR